MRAELPADEAEQHDQKEGKEKERKGSAEMMRNPVALAVFQNSVERPLAVTAVWIGCLIASICIASQYSYLKHQPLQWHAFDNSLKEAQTAFITDFSGANSSLLGLESVVVWSPTQQDLTRMPEFTQARSAVDRVLQSAKQLRTPACPREVLAKMTWTSYAPWMPPSLAKQFLSADKSASTFLVQHTCNLAEIRQQLATIDQKHGGLRVAVGSPNAVVAASVVESMQQVTHHMWICAPIMWALLWWNTGSMFRALTAFICLLCSMFGTRAVTVIIKWVWPALNFSGPNEVVIMFIELALCLDYCLFFWTRFSQERGAHPGPEYFKAALMTTLQTSGAVILVSVCVLVIGTLAMCFYPDQNNLGALATNVQLVIGILLLGVYSLVVPASVAALLPSLFDVGEGGAAGCSFCAGQGSGAGKLGGQLGGAHRGLVRRWSIFVTSSPWMVLLPLLVGACFVPLIMELAHFQPNFDLFAASASHRVPEYQAFSLLRAKFNLGRLEPVPVLLEAYPLGPAMQDPTTHLTRDAMAMVQVRVEPQCPDCTSTPARGGAQAEVLAALGSHESRARTSGVALTAPFQHMACQYIANVVRGTRSREYQIKAEDVQSIWWNRTSGTCAEVPQVQDSDSQALLSMSGTRQVLRLFPPVHGTSAASQAMTRFFWNHIEPQSSGTFVYQGQRFQFRAQHLTDTATIMLMQQKFADRAPWIMVVLVVLICLVVGALFSSVGLGLKMIITVVLPIVAEFGLIVGIYQRGWMEWAGIERTDGLVWSHLYTTVGLLLGLAIDYDIFLFARVYERRLEGYDNTSAVRMAVNETASVITVAGTVMCVSFFFVSLSSIFIVSQLGVLYFFGVAFDTYIVRTIMAPSVLCVSEKMNYWPGYIPPATKSWPADVQKQ